MKSLLLLIITLHLASAATHSLQFFLTGVTPCIRLPEFTAVSELDGLQVGYYDSNSKEVIPRAEWIKDYKDEEHWNFITQDAHHYQEVFKVTINKTMQLFNQTEGNHMWQWAIGCELHDVGTKSGYSKYGYDGEDFLSLDLNTETWTLANDKALITKREWEKTDKAKGHKTFLGTECIEWLQMYVDFGRATLERKAPPEASLFQKDSSSPVVCHTTGFFPSAVNITWKKNGEDLHEDVELRETLPNQDGTFQKRSVLTVSPEELNKHNYTCIIQHSSLEEKMVLTVSDHRVLPCGGLDGLLVGTIVAVLLLVCVGVFIWKKKQSLMDFSSNNS